MEELISDIKIEVEKIVGDCCETTDDDPLTKHIEIKKKRKIASELYDFLDIEKLKRIKAEAQDSPVTGTMEEKRKDLMSPVVYTTRLDDMNIYRKKLENLESSYILEEILRESKPVYNYLQQTTNFTEPMHINKDPEKLVNFINRINNKKPQIEELEDLEVIEICSPSSKSGTPSNEDNRKAGERKVKRKRKASDEIDEQTIINIVDDLIDLTDIPALNDKDIEKDTIQPDTMISYRSQDLIEKVIHKNNVLLENLQTTRMDILKQLNDMESSEELEADVSVDNIPKLETTERRENLSQGIMDLTQGNRSETSMSPIVYTTRLDEMLVLRYSLKYLDGKYALKEIIRESKPDIKLLRKQKNKANSCRISFKRLKVKLKILNRKNKNNNVDMKKSTDTPTLNNCNVSRTEFLCHSIHSTDNTSLLLDLNNPGSNFFISNPNTTELERVEVCRNIALIIHNKYSDQANMFLTDDRGNVTDYRSWTIGRSPNLDDLYKENDPKKKIIKLSTCCWFHTKANVEKVWTRTATGIARFVQSIHKCLPGICKCCCKPRRISGSFKLKFDTIKEDENKKKTLKKDKINSLIGRALEYRKRNVVKENNKTKPDIGQPLLIEVNKGKKDYRGDALKYFGINAKGNVEWQNAFYRWRTYSLDHITRLKRWMGANTSELKYNKNNHNWLMCTLKAFDVPFNTIKYVKLTETSDDSQIKDTPSRKPDLLQLIMDTPVIEHTRKCAEVKLIKIKDILNSNPVPKRGTIHVKNIDKMMPNILLINPEPSTSGLSTGYPPNAIVQPLQPTQLVRPVQPVQPMQPLQPIQPTQPVRPMQLVQPMQTVQPVQLMQPIQPQQPVPATESQYRSQSSQTMPYSKPIRPKPPPQPVVNLSKRLIVTCTEFPQMVNVIEDVAPDAAKRLLDEFRNITFQIKQGKIVATLKSSEKTTLTDKFEILAKILQLTQSEISNHASVQDMILHINIRCEPMTSDSDAVIIVHPLETVPKTLEEKFVRNVTQTDTDTKSTQAAMTNKTIIEKFVQNKFAQFSRYGMFEKKSYKKSFQMYIKSEEEKRVDTDDMVFPIISNVFSLSDSKSTDLLNEAPKNDFKDICSSFEPSNSIVFINDVGNQAGQSALPVNQNYLQMVPEVNKNNSSSLNGILKNDLSDTCSSFASSRSKVIVNDENSQSSQLPLPAYPNFVQTAGQNQFLRISSKTIVENTIATMVNKNNILLRSLLEKKTDIIFDNVLQKKKKK